MVGLQETAARWLVPAIHQSKVSRAILLECVSIFDAPVNINGPILGTQERDTLRGHWRVFGHDESQMRTGMKDRSRFSQVLWGVGQYRCRQWMFSNPHMNPGSHIVSGR